MIFIVTALVAAAWVYIKIEAYQRYFEVAIDDAEDDDVDDDDDCEDEDGDDDN